MDLRADKRSLLNINLLHLLDLLDFLHRLMHNLLFNCRVFDSFLNSLSWHVFDILVLVNLRDIFSLVFDSVVVGDFLLLRNVFDSLDCLILDNGLFVGDVFNSRFTLDNSSSRRLDRDSRDMDSGLLETWNSERLGHDLRLYQRLVHVLRLHRA